LTLSTDGKLIKKNKNTLVAIKVMTGVQFYSLLKYFIVARRFPVNLIR